MDATVSNNPNANIKKRYGLFPARIGRTFAHKLGIDMPLATPQYPTKSTVIGALPATRTRARVATPSFRMGKSPVSEEVIPIAALPGATVQLDVQALADVEPELLPHLKWTCMHPGCAGKRWDDRDKMRAAHGDEMELRKTAERDPSGGHAHCYVGVIEREGRVESRDDKTGKVTPARETVVMLVSDEE